MEEFDEVSLVLDEHALPCALKAQGILGLCKVCGVGEKCVGAIQVLCNVDPDTNLVLMLETLQRHDTESTDLANAHGLPASSILADTNHVIHVPATLFPAPRPD